MAGPTFDNAQLNIQGVTSIIVSTIQPDLNSTQYLRLIQIYVDPSSVSNRRPVLTLALYGGDQESADISGLQIAVPGGLDF